MLVSDKEQLAIMLQNVPQEDFPVHSRVHRLNVSDTFGIECYVKREDELGCLVSGSKVRKARSLIAALKKQGCKKVGLIGGQYSNHVLGMSSLLIENEIEPTLFLLESKEYTPVGNALFIQLLVPPKNIRLIPRERWHEAPSEADAWKTTNSQYRACVVPEGGLVKDSMAGLATLALDILQNEEQVGTVFKEILIDSGSGLTAASLIAAFGFLKKEVHIHICQAADGQEEFLGILHQIKESLEALTGKQIDYMPKFSLHKPTTARSFGSTNATVFQTIAHVAQTEGFFLDPIYSVKLYLLLKELLETKTLSGPVLFIHSGGVFSLSGFQPQLLLQKPLNTNIK